MEFWDILIFTNVDELEYDQQKGIYQSFWKFLYPDIYYLVYDHAFTEDVIQESYLKIVTKKELVQVVNKKAWIRRVARNTAYDLLKKNNKYVYVIDSLDNYIKFEHESLSEIVEEDMKRKMLFQAIMELKKDYQLVLLLYYFEEKSYKEIMEQLSISQGTLTQRLARSRKKLHQLYLKKAEG